MDRREYHVRPSGDGHSWRIEHGPWSEGTLAPSHAAAVQLANQMAQLNAPSLVVVHDAEGQIASRVRYD